jgi:sigma-B regulation protein RsbU (phosphoserine phosphatase)
MSAPSTATPEPQTSSQPVLLYVQGAEQRTIALEHLPFTIGRKTDRDLVIADSRVSREHAMIIAENGEYYVVDQSSRHGTFVNGIKRDRQRLQPNDRLDFGARDASYCIFNPERARTSSAAEFLSQISMMSVPAGGSELEKLRIFLEAARRLSTHGVLDDVLVTLLDSTLRLTKAERGFVFLKDPDGKLRLAAGRNARGDVLADDSAISRSILEEAAHAASEFVVSDTSKSSDLAGRQSIIAYDLRTVIAVPLRKTQMGKAVTTETAEIRLQQEKQADVRGVLYLDSRFASRDLPGVSHDILRAIATEAAALVENAHLVAAEEEAKRYQQELSIAASIQQRLMSVDFPDVPYASVRATNLACKDVGGDFFDVVLTDRGLALIVADVSGKGISAALLASILQGLIYSQLLADVPLADIVTAANRFLCQRVAGQKYATLIVALLSPNGELEFVNCGHVPPVLTSDGQVTRPRECNLPIGLLAGGEYQSTRLKLSPGGRLLILTDGVTEAEDASGEFYGDKRLEDAAAGPTPYEAVFDSVRAFCGDTPLSDDCTLVELLYKG